MVADIGENGAAHRSASIGGEQGKAAQAYGLLALASLCWSGNHVLGRAIAGHVPPLGISTVRWLVPALVLWLFARAHLRRDWPEIRRHWRIMLFLGLTGGSIFTGLQYVAPQYTTALNISVLNSLAPVFMVMAGGIVFFDRLHLRQALGLAVSLLGVLAIVAQGEIESLAQFRFNRGDVIIVFNMVVWAFYSACLRLCPKIHWLSFLFVIGVISSAGTLPLAMWEGYSGYTFQPTWLTAFAVLYVAILPSVVAFASWNRGVAVIGNNRSGPFLHLIPIYSAVLASVLLGEQLMAYHVVGFVLILLGVWLAAREYQPSQRPTVSEKERA
jgi:drug/metabolite transporter (DMT)-like permease